MDEQAKKTALRMIPYGLYVLGTSSGERMNAAAVNWLTQTSFKPPLVALGLKADSEALQLAKDSGCLALSFLEAGQKDIAFAFFKPTDVQGNTINGFRFETHETGAPILLDAPAWFEARVRDTVDGGDHSVVIAEVIAAGVRRESRVLTLEECGVSYGG